MGPAGFLNVLNVLRYCDKCEKLFFFVFFWEIYAWAEKFRSQGEGMYCEYKTG